MKTAGSGLMHVVFLLSLLVPLCAGAQDNHGHTGKKLFTKHFQETLFDITEHAIYSVEVLLDEKEYKIGKNVIGFVLHNDRDEDVLAARLTIVLKNLQTGEKAPGTITVTDKGNGLYIVSGLNLQREGRWELVITAQKGKAEDRVLFVFPDALKERHPKGRYSP